MKSLCCEILCYIMTLCLENQNAYGFFSFATLVLFIAEAATVEFIISLCYFLNKNIHSIVFFISVISKISTILFIKIGFSKYFLGSSISNARKCVFYCKGIFV